VSSWYKFFVHDALSIDENHLTCSSLETFGIEASVATANFHQTNADDCRYIAGW
jgi:hypothetical protein